MSRRVAVLNDAEGSSSLRRPVVKTSSPGRALSLSEAGKPCSRKRSAKVKLNVVLPDPGGPKNSMITSPPRLTENLKGRA